jgi:hypothetical protein
MVFVVNKVEIGQVFLPFVIRLFALTPIFNLQRFIIISLFPFSALLLTAFYYTNPFFLMGISSFIYASSFSNKSRELKAVWV